MSAPGWIAVGLLGGVAAGARFVIDAEIAARVRSPFPLGIFAVNLAGALALGLVAGAALHGEALAIVAGGGIGSFTTFSTWILDSHRLREGGQADLALLNLGLSLVVGFAAVTFGHWAGTLV
ncbi:MAG TPA: fluoride efflux transporter CrcB [Solirubrobacterales bacterium]|jgi:CrcB protein